MTEREDGRMSADTVDARAFRETMSRLSLQVHLVTSVGAAGRCGVTVTAMTAVSDTPPTVLFCLNRASRSHDTFMRNGVFCVNTLAGPQADLADTFAGRDGLDMDARFARADWREMETGSPVLAEALAAFDCRITEVVTAATHSVFFGAVVALSNGPRTQPPLTHRNRAYDLG